MSAADRVTRLFEPIYQSVRHDAVRILLFVPDNRASLRMKDQSQRAT